MSSHKGPAVAQGNGAPASNRAADTVELAELAPLLEEKGKRAVTPSTKAKEAQACPGPQEEEEEARVLTLSLQAHHATEKMEEFVYKVGEGRRLSAHGHRPPMPSFRACYKSIFRIHTETSNVWTHLLAAAHLPLHRLRPGHLRHHCGSGTTLPHTSTGRQGQGCSSGSA
uniref:Uncharacterized protein n=1 Tax=Moschus moschiferus TaxID=68415 RepID=A0A8C6EFV2_MOSMO